MPRVMVVDDSRVELNMLCAALSRSGFEVIPLADSDGAQHIAADMQPDFIVLDIFMPNKSGLELCEELKTNPATAQIPIIFLTGSESIEDVRQSIHMGCIDFIPKPADMNDIVNTIKTFDVINQLRTVWDPVKHELARISEKYS